jgi:OTU-like cysteine protease
MQSRVSVAFQQVSYDTNAKDVYWCFDDVKLQLDNADLCFKCIVMQTLAELLTFHSLNAGRQGLKVGFPPKEVPASSSTDTPIIDLGISNGSVVTVTEQAAAAVEQQLSTAAVDRAASASPLTVAAAQNTGSIVETLTAMGFSAAVASQAATLADGDINGALELCMSGGLSEDTATGADTAATQHKPTFVRRVIDADNTCLFNSVGYCLHGAAAGRRAGPAMRQIIKDAVLASPDVFSEAILGQSPQQYCEWILKSDKWGGEIEIFILSTHFKVEVRSIVFVTTLLQVYAIP